MDEEVGYCQGMNLVAGMILLHIGEEQTSFFILKQIMLEKDWRSVFMEYTPKVIGIVETLKDMLMTDSPNLY
jgi:hypothetical protein